MSKIVQRDFPKQIDLKFGILCLSEHPDSLLMWAHYAEAHQGFVIEFDPKSTFFDQRLGSPGDELRHLRKVVYKKRRPAISIIGMTGTDLLLTKGKEWHYEAEWRMIMPLELANHVEKVGASIVHLFDFPKSSVKRVIFGCRMTDAERSEISQVLTLDHEFSHVIESECILDEEIYRLHIRNLPTRKAHPVGRQ